MANKVSKRQRVLLALAKILSDDERTASMSENARDALVRRIERGCNNLTFDLAVARHLPMWWNNKLVVAVYSEVVYRVLENLDANSYQHRREGLDLIISGACKPSHFAYKNSDEICPEVASDVKTEVQIRLAQHIDRKVSHMYKCSQCGHNETHIMEYQARAADECSTVSIMCVRCGKIWRQG